MRVLIFSMFMAIGLFSGAATAQPVITSIEPGAMGHSIYIYGTGFSTTNHENVVAFPGAPATTTPAISSTTRLSVNIPEGTTSGHITVSVNGQSSAPSSATLRIINDGTTCSAAGFTPQVLPNGFKLCVFPAGFSDNTGDILILGEASTSGEGYILSTSSMVKASGTTITLNGQIILQRSSSTNFGRIYVNRTNFNQATDTLNMTGDVFIFGELYNYGNANLTGDISVQAGGGAIRQQGPFTVSSNSTITVDKTTGIGFLVTNNATLTLDGTFNVIGTGTGLDVTVGSTVQVNSGATISVATLASVANYGVIHMCGTYTGPRPNPLPYNTDKC